MKINSTYDPTTGVSTCVIQDNRGSYTATTRLHPDDLDVKSAYAGCHFAEMKARTKQIKAEIHEAKIELRTMERLYQELSQLRVFSLYKNTKVMRQIRKKIMIKKNEIKRLQSTYDFSKINYKATTDRNLDIRRKCQKYNKEKSL